MVLYAYEIATDTESVERVSPSCRTVTQSPKAMNESSHTRGQRKYRNISESPAYVVKVEQSVNDSDASVAASPDSMSTQRESAEGSGEMSPRTENEGSAASAGRKKGLQKLASGAIANIGSVLRGGASGEADGRSELTAGRSSRNAAKGSANIHDLTPDSDPGMQEKLSPTGSQKESFFNKSWRNRLKVISNAGNALWIPQVRVNKIRRALHCLLIVAFKYFVRR